MAECAPEEMPLDEYYTAPFKPDRTFEYTPLVVPRLRNYVLGQKLRKQRKQLLALKKTLPRAEFFERLKSHFPMQKSWIKSLQHQIFESQENRRSLEKSNRALMEENERLQAQIETLTSQGSSTNERLREMKHKLEPQYCSREGLDSRMKRKEDVIHSIAAASRRLEDDYQRKTTLRMQTDSEVQNLLPRNRNLLMHALDFLHHAKWSLNEMPSHIEDIETSEIPQEQLSKTISDADDEISHFNLSLRVATKNLVDIEAKLKKETQELEKSKIDLDIFSKDETCLKQVAKVEKTMKGIINFIFKAREMVEESYHAIEAQERDQRKKKDEHNRELRKANFQSSQRPSRTRSVGGYYSMGGEVLCDLPYKPTYSDQNVMQNRLQEVPTVREGQNSSRLQQYQETVDDLLRAIEEKRAPAAEFGGERIERRRQSAISEHARRQSLAKSRRAEAAALAGRVPGDSTFSRRSSLEGIRGRTASVSRLAQRLPAGEGQTAPAEHARRHSIGHDQRRTPICQREHSSSYIG